jgi:hypothetical protein
MLAIREASRVLESVANLCASILRDATEVLCPLEELSAMLWSRLIRDRAIFDARAKLRRDRAGRAIHDVPDILEERPVHIAADADR